MSEETAWYKQFGRKWIKLTEADIAIPDHILDELFHHYNEYSFFEVDQMNETKKFYEYMIGHPRLTEFINKEISSVIDKIKIRFYNNPELVEKAITSLSTQVLGSTKEEFEEFLDNRKNVKGFTQRNTISLEEI